MTKKDTVNALGSTADILELLGENEFKVLAYRKAERVLENMTGEMTSKSVDLMLSVKNEGDKPYVMGLRKYEMQQGEKAGRTNSRWMVHSLDPKS